MSNETNNESKNPKNKILDFIRKYSLIFIGALSLTTITFLVLTVFGFNNNVSNDDDYRINGNDEWNEAFALDSYTDYLISGTKATTQNGNMLFFNDFTLELHDDYYYIVNDNDFPYDTYFKKDNETVLEFCFEMRKYLSASPLEVVDYFAVEEVDSHLYDRYIRETIDFDRFINLYPSMTYDPSTKSYESQEASIRFYKGKITSLTLECEDGDFVYAYNYLFIKPQTCHYLPKGENIIKMINIEVEIDGEGTFYQDDYYRIHEGEAISFLENSMLIEDELAINAIPSDGYAFEGWYVDEEKLIDGHEYVFHENKVITAKFVELPSAPYSITFSLNNATMGKVEKIAGVDKFEIGENNFVYFDGAVLQIYEDTVNSATLIYKATPYSGYKLSHWAMNGEKLEKNHIERITEDTEFTAYFEVQ